MNVDLFGFEINVWWDALARLGLAVGVAAAIGFYHLHWTMFF